MFKRCQKPSVVEDVHLMCICMILPMKVVSSKPLKTMFPFAANALDMSYRNRRLMPRDGSANGQGLYLRLKMVETGESSMMFHDKINHPGYHRSGHDKIWQKWPEHARALGLRHQSWRIFGEGTPHILLVHESLILGAFQCLPVSVFLGKRHVEELCQSCPPLGESIRLY